MKTSVKNTCAKIGMMAGMLLAFSHATDMSRDPGKVPSHSTLSQSDLNFMRAAAQGGMTEVKLGEIASQKGDREVVRNFGSMMVKDHSAMNDDMKALALQKSVTLPDNLDATHQAVVDKLDGLSGAAFDKAYVAEMIKDHKKDAKDFKSQAGKTKDADLKAFLDKSIPVVESHLKHVKALKK